MKKTDRMIKGIFSENPALVAFMGLCPALAVTTGLREGLVMGGATMAVLLCSNLLISLFRKIIPEGVKVLCGLLIAAIFTVAVDLVLQAWLPNISTSLGIFVPLIAVNCIVLSNIGLFAKSGSAADSLVGALSTGLGFSIVLAIMGAVREIVGAGTIWGLPLAEGNSVTLPVFSILPGGFLVLAVMAAAMKYILNKRNQKNHSEEGDGQ